MSLRTACRRAAEDYGYYLKSMPWLCALGVALGVLSRSRRVATVLVAGYFVLYAGVQLAILPEIKHWGPLLLPLHVLAATGLWQLLRVAVTLRRGLGSIDLGARLRTPAWIACVCLLCWGLLGVVAHTVSQSQRRRIVDGILAAARSPLGPDRSPDTPRLHTIEIPSGEPTRPIGYLFRVKGARRSVDLFCLHAREAIGQESVYYSTRHELDANSEQFFFVNPVAGTGVGETRSYTLEVSVRGQAQLLSVTSVDLSERDLGLPLSLVFTRESDQPGLWLRPYVTEAFSSLQEAESFVRGR